MVRNKKMDVQHKALLWLSGFIGLGAYWGGALMFISPDGSLLGMVALLPPMQYLPYATILFQDFIFSGIMLILINGLCNTLAVIGLLKKKRWGVICGLLSGVMLLCWLSVQWAIFEINILTSLFTLFSIIQIWLAYLIILKKNWK